VKVADIAFAQYCPMLSKRYRE